jgi:hypothetical protein
VGNIDYGTLSDLQVDLLQTCEDAGVDRFILDEGGQYYQNGWDKISLKMVLSTNDAVRLSGLQRRTTIKQRLGNSRSFVYQ